MCAEQLASPVISSLGMRVWTLNPCREPTRESGSRHPACPQAFVWEMGPAPLLALYRTRPWNGCENFAGRIGIFDTCPDSHSIAEIRCRTGAAANGKEPGLRPAHELQTALRPTTDVNAQCGDAQSTAPHDPYSERALQHQEIRDTGTALVLADVPRAHCLPHFIPGFSMYLNVNTEMAVTIESATAIEPR